MTVTMSKRLMGDAVKVVTIVMRLLVTTIKVSYENELIYT
jgi:hypothetical protein